MLGTGVSYTKALTNVYKTVRERVKLNALFFEKKIKVRLSLLFIKCLLIKSLKIAADKNVAML